MEFDNCSVVPTNMTEPCASSAGAQSLPPCRVTDAPQLTTIIVTRHRVKYLKRAIQSLAAQQPVQVALVVLIDDCSSTSSFLEELRPPIGAIQSVRWTNAKRAPHVRTGPKHLAALRNRALQMVATSWCSYLDDDNELEPKHLSKLMECILQSGSPATHSWRSLWTRDGRPYYLKDRHPWCRDPRLARKLFVQYRDAGIYQAGTNIVHDQVVPFCRHESMVDMSEWLFETGFIRSIGFEENYSSKDQETCWAEDAKLLDDIVTRGLGIPSTKEPSLRYYLGGYSNNWANIDKWI